jgi:hypothetical protein
MFFPTDAKGKRPSKRPLKITYLEIFFAKQIIERTTHTPSKYLLFIALNNNNNN